MIRMRLRNAIFPVLTLCAGTALAASVASPSSGDRELDSRVKKLLSQMTLEEKVGQMTQVTLDVVFEDPESKIEPHKLSPKKLEDAIVGHHVGSILNVGTSESSYGVDRWHEVIRAVEEVATQKTRLKIPVLYGIDAIHGPTYTLGGTLFPQALGAAATWNPELLRKEGEITSREVHASGIQWNFYPVMDVARQPLWSRVFETYGEDPTLASAMGSAYISGHQEAAVCLKHYVGYSFPWSGKDRTPAYMTERMLREFFLPSFEAGVKAGAQAVMVNSGEIDGVAGHANHRLLTDILRGELGFRGLVVSDWEDIRRLYTRDRVARTPEDAVRMAVMAGVDMSMVPLDFSFYDILIKLVQQKKVPMSRIDEAVSRILRVKFQTGLFEHFMPDDSLKSRIAMSDATEANLKTAQESITLLKNDANTLPLAKKVKVLVAGPNADLLSVLNGAWTISWQGEREWLYPKDKKTLLIAIRDKIGEKNVVYQKEPAAALKAADDVDAVILCLGEKTYTETPGNIDDLTLDADQLELAAKFEKTGKPVVVVLTEGRPRVIRPIVDGARAIVMAYLPGMEGARAVADVLFGDVNPSGKLPITYPRYTNSLIPYDHLPMEEAEGNVFNPQFPFGYGLSYTTFAYDDLKLGADKITRDQPLDVSVKVTNTGTREGKEVVQLYLTDLYASVSQPVKRLRAFQKVGLAPGESKTVHFQLKPRDYSFINSANKRVTEPGPFRAAVGSLSREFEVQ